MWIRRIGSNSEDANIEAQLATGYVADMDVSLSAEQETKLGFLAQSTGRDQDDLVREAVDRFLDHDRWFREQVQIGVDQLERGEFVEDEEVRARVG